MTYSAQRVLFQALEARRLFTAGELDASFGINGSKSLHETGDLPGTWLSVISLPGDKYLTAGTVRKTDSTDPTDLLIARYLGNGQLDPTFGTNGYSIINVGSDEYVRGVYATTDGYLIRGQLGRDAATFKITTSGTLDTSFADNGILENLSVRAVQSDGGLIAVDGLTFGRLLANGSPDASFNNGAMIDLVTATPLRSSGSDMNILLQKSGKIIAVTTGERDDDFSSDSQRAVVTRWDTAGNLDGTFGKNGVLIASPAKAAALDSTDRLVMLLSHNGPTLSRFTSNGAMDSSFKPFRVPEATALAVDSSNRILISNGSFLYRYKDQGVYDRRFGFFANTSMNRFDSSVQFTVDAKQKIVVVGGRGTLPMIQRIQSADDGRAVLFNPKLHAIDIYGTTKADRLDVTYSYNKQTMTIVLNGKSKTYSLEDVRAIYFDAGAGNDVVRFNNKYARLTFLGGDGNDDCKVIAADRYAGMYGGKGNDRLDASGIFAKFAGHGTLWGEDGDDTLIGSNEQDDLFGNRGNDVLIGNGNNDSLDGGTGNDSLNGGDGNDKLRGSDGNDTLEGAAGYDSYQGGKGNDVYKMVDGLNESAYEGNGDNGYDIAYIDSHDKAHGTFLDIEKLILV